MCCINILGQIIIYAKMFLTEQWRMDSGRMEIKAKASRASAFYIHSFSIQTYNAQIFKRNILTFLHFDGSQGYSFV